MKSLTLTSLIFSSLKWQTLFHLSPPQCQRMKHDCKRIIASQIFVPIKMHILHKRKRRTDLHTSHVLQAFGQCPRGEIHRLLSVFAEVQSLLHFEIFYQLQMVEELCFGPISSYALLLPVQPYQSKTQSHLINGSAGDQKYILQVTNIA